MAATGLTTVSDYVTDARTLLQDKVLPYRYSDDEVVTALNATLLDARRLRPDLFLGDGTDTFLDAITTYTTNDTTVVDIEQGFRLAVLYGVIGHAFLRDQEDVQDARSQAFLKLFRDKLMTLDA